MVGDLTSPPEEGASNPLGLNPCRHRPAGSTSTRLNSVSTLERGTTSPLAQHTAARV